MQEVSALYEKIYMSRKWYMETSLVIGDKGVLVTEVPERNTFGDGITFEKSGILVATSSANGGYGENMLIDVKTTRRVFSNNRPEVGCCPSGEIYVEMHMPKGSIERMAVLIPYIRLISTETGEKSEWVRKGVFFLDTRDNTHNDDGLDILTMHGYDAMMKAETEYGELFEKEDFSITNDENATTPHWTKVNGTYKATITNSKLTADKKLSIQYIDEDSIALRPSWSRNGTTVTFTTTTAPPANVFGKFIIGDANTITFPNTDINVVKDIANKIGVELDERSTETHKSVYDYINKGYQIQYPSNYTMREVLGYIGAMYVGNWIINDLGELQFVALYDLPEETSLVTDEFGYRLVFGSSSNSARIKIYNT